MNTPPSAHYRCPSNIALVKYWGKKNTGIQLPANPSISLTLSDIFTETKVTLAHGNVSGKPAFSFLYNGQPRRDFEGKLQTFFQRIWDRYEVVRNHHLHIETRNNFPHGAGIASSAAGFGALALCVTDLEQQVKGVGFTNFLKESSFTARLGSGSASRSMYAEPAIWGVNPEIPGSSDEYAIPLSTPVADPLNTLMDIVLIVDAGEKRVSSSEGHSLLASNPGAAARFETANRNIVKLIVAMQKGNVRSFVSIVESEALQLHAMMMSGSPYYLLMRPNTLAIIEEIWAYREKSGLPVMFTLDAGPNVHLLFPSVYREQIVQFVESHLLGYCQNGQYLCSNTCTAPEKLT